MPSLTSSLSRKEREFIAREELILKHARRLLLEKGFQAWNMEQLAEAVEYSKGTLYQHFSSKEDLVLGVATQSLRQRADLFEQAATFQGRTRERCRAIGFACCEFAMAHPEMTALSWPITHECTPVARSGLSAQVWFACRRKVVRLSVLVLQPQPGGRNPGKEGGERRFPVQDRVQSS